MKPSNVLFIVSDEHGRRVLGCDGDQMTRRPNLDRLAANGIRFSEAYCTSPSCVSSCARIATGQYVDKIRFRDNGVPYDGSCCPGTTGRKRPGTSVDRETAFPQH